MKKIDITLLIIVILVIIMGNKKLQDTKYQNENNNYKSHEQTNNDVLDVILSRKTARNFSEKEVSEEDIKKILTSAMSSPTSGNQKSWEFIVVKDGDVLDKIQENHPYSSALDTAPITIIVAADTKNAAYPENWVQDTSAAAQNIIIEATSLDLATNLMSIYPQEDRMKGVQEALNLPEYVLPSVMISIGYNDEVTSGASSDSYNEDKVHHDSWNK